MAKSMLCGSVNLETREDVFRTVTSIVGPSMKRLTDGETGPRNMWTDTQFPRMVAMPQFEPIDDGGVKPHLRIKEGVDIGDLRFPFDYVEHAIDSYEAFAALKEDGVIPATTRFQVSIPTAMAFSMYIYPPDVPAVFPAIERDVIEQIRSITAAIPHDQLAIQLDVAAEFAVVEGYLPNLYGDDLSALTDTTVKLGAAVPEDVELGIHLCYGDEPGDDGLGHHFKEPTDTSKLVTFANELSKAMPRPIAWIHMPVPIERDDDAYFAPLSDLDLQAETELYLGLVHREDGIEGAQRRADAASKYVKGFGVATECGMGRDPRDAIPGLLKVHADVEVPS